MQDLTIDDFAPWVNGACDVTGPDGQVSMTLVSADPLPRARRDGGGFRLEFEGPAEPLLSQGIMTVSGPGAAHEIFLVPIARDKSATRYEAVFY